MGGELAIPCEDLAMWAKSTPAIKDKLTYVKVEMDMKTNPASCEGRPPCRASFSLSPLH